MKIATLQTEGDTWVGEYEGEYAFRASPNLYLIRVAWARGLDVEDLADGFGEGFGTQGDWSAIRDSSVEAKDAMLLAALRFLGLDSDDNGWRWEP